MNAREVSAGTYGDPLAGTSTPSDVIRKLRDKLKQFTSADMGSGPDTRSLFRQKVPWRLPRTMGDQDQKDSHYGAYCRSMVNLRAFCSARQSWPILGSFFFATAKRLNGLISPSTKRSMTNREEPQTLPINGPSMGLLSSIARMAIFGSLFCRNGAGSRQTRDGENHRVPHRTVRSDLDGKTHF